MLLNFHQLPTLLILLQEHTDGTCFKTSPKGVDVADCSLYPPLPKTVPNPYSSAMVFSSPSSELLFLSSWHRAGDAAVIAGEEETEAKRMMEGKKKSQGQLKALSYFLLTHSLLRRSGQCRNQTLIKDAAPNCLHRAHSVQWEPLSAELG